MPYAEFELGVIDQSLLGTLQGDFELGRHRTILKRETEALSPEPWNVVRENREKRILIGHGVGRELRDLPALKLLLEAGLHVEAAAGVAPTDFAATAGDPLVELGTLSDALDLAVPAGTVGDGLHALDPDFALAGAMALPDGGLTDGASLDWTYDGPA